MGGKGGGGKGGEGRRERRESGGGARTVKGMLSGMQKRFSTVAKWGLLNTLQSRFSRPVQYRRQVKTSLVLEGTSAGEGVAAGGLWA